jgi:FdhE protein
MWFRRGRLPLPDDVDEARAQLGKLVEDRPALADAARLHAELLERLWSVQVTEPPPAMTAEHAQAKLASGIPLLRGETVLVDRTAWLARLHGVCVVLQKQTPQARIMDEVVRSGRVDPMEITARVVAGAANELHDTWEQCGIPADLADTILRYTLFPLFTTFREKLDPLRLGFEWPRGYCPVCGSWPVLGEFRGLDQVRFLRCALCAAAWEFPRSACPFCENRDHRRLGFLFVEGQEANRRVFVCRECHWHVRMVTTLQPLTAPQVLVKDLETVDLTLVANRVDLCDFTHS